MRQFTHLQHNISTLKHSFMGGGGCKRQEKDRNTFEKRQKKVMRTITSINKQYT